MYKKDIKSIKFLVFCILLYIFLISLSKTVFSQIIIDKAKIKLDVFEGQTISDSITVNNLSDKEIKVRVYPQDFVYLPPFDGSKNFLPLGSTPNSCARWLNFTLQEFTLPPYGMKVFNYSINVPWGVSGGYYAVLFFETSPTPFPMENKDIELNFAQRVGCLFFLESENKIKKGEVEVVFVKDNFIEGNFGNRGNTILTPDTVFYIMDREGLIIDRGNLDTFYIPPQEKFTFTINLPENLPKGEYTVVINFDLDGDFIVKEIDLVKDLAGKLIIREIRD
ncbi:MAG: hypothetical protein NC904_07790 [Candidatus Omnitrophica bacterium]|nr:hypothetical protein [Candidatus Omnitrophota bacterium]